MTASPIMDIIKSETHTMINNPLLESMESSNLSRENWTVWACQRYHAAHRFIPLLEAGLKGARQAGVGNLEKVLQNNIDDENGINNPQLGSHEKWRQDFYGAMGITQEHLDDAVLLPGTIEYRETMESLEQGNPHEIIGALLYLEFSIPHEFRRIQIGRDLTFPDKFVIQRGDGKEKKKQKGLARLYIDHHITHDADSHFPDLMQTIEPLLQGDGGEKIVEGVRIIARAKKQFYACLGRELMGGQLHYRTLPEKEFFHGLTARYGKGKTQENAEFQGVHRCDMSQERISDLLKDLSVPRISDTVETLKKYQHFDLVYMEPDSTITPHKHQTEAFALTLRGSGEIIVETENTMVGKPSQEGTIVVFESGKGHALTAGKGGLLFLAGSVTPIVEGNKIIDLIKEDGT